MEESIPINYGENILNELNIPVENIKEEFPVQQRPSTFKKGLIGFYGNDYYLIFNYSLLTDEIIASNGIKLFLMDKSDVEYFEDPSAGNKNTDMLKNLETFMSFKPDKKIYLRVFKPLQQGMQVDHILKDEVLTILPMVLKQQGDPIPTEKIEALRPKWTDKTGYHGPTINISLFLILLSRTFDIDTSLITLVNDLSLTWSCHASLKSGGITTVRFQNQDGKYMTHPSHAAFSFFQSWICGTNCNDMIAFNVGKPTCLMQMLEYNRIEKDLMILDIQINKSVETNDLTDYDYRLPGQHYEDTILISYYLKMCKEYGIPNYREHIKRSDGKIEVYLARALMIVGWMELLFGDDREFFSARDLVIDGFSCLIPKDNLSDFQCFLKNVFPIGLYSRNEFLASGLVDPYKEENNLIARLAAANEKRKQKLQEKKNGKKKKQTVPKKTEPEPEEMLFNPELAQLAQQMFINALNSAQNVKNEDLDNARNSDDVGTVEEVVEAPSESQAENSKKKNNKKKKKRQAASEEVAEEIVEGTMKDSQPAEQLELDVEPLADPVSMPVEPEAAKPDDTDPEAAEPVAAEPINPPPAARDPKQESSSCSKCLRTSKKCQDAIKAANIAQNKADSFESKAKRTDEVEKRMRVMEEEMKQMKIKLATSLKHSEENERLRQKISKREKIEEDLRREKKELIHKNEKLETEIRNLNEKPKNLEEKIVNEKLETEERIALMISNQQSATLEIVNEFTFKNRIHQDEITNLKDSMNKKQAELFQAMEINGKYYMENSLLKSKVNRLENDITRLREQASQALEPVAMDRRKLLELRKLKDDFGRNTIMEEAKEKVDKIKTLPDTTENLAGALEAAENELLRLETSIYNYQDFLDLNVRIYQKSHDISKILELPEYPKISEGFSDLYSRLFPVTAPETGIPDTDCPICYETRQPEEEILGCNGCPYIFHLSCLRKWFENKNGCTKCPQCQKTLRDPDQYPMLQ
ncbi:unnamed protein product [Caenorhabditis brenneri]